MCKEHFKHKGQPFSTAMSYHWSDIAKYVNLDSIDHIFQANDNDKVVLQMTKFIEDDQPNLMFVHLDSVDHAGHTGGWGSETYVAAMLHVDSLLHDLIQCIEKQDLMRTTAIIVMSPSGSFSASI